MDFIPGPDKDLLDFAAGFVAAAGTYSTLLGASAMDVDAISEKKIAFGLAYDAAKLPTHSPLDTTIKKEKRRALVRAIRHFKKRFLDPAENLDDTVWEAFGLKPPDRKPSPRPTPKNKPVVRAELFPPGIIKFFFHGLGKEWGKDPDAHGLELCWAVLDQPPADVEELVHSAFETKSPISLEFKFSDRGKILYYAARWESGTAHKGPWTTIESVVIP